MNRGRSVILKFGSTAIACLLAGNLSALPLISSVQENGTALHAQAAVVSSASNPGGSGTSGALGDEAFSMATRTHEYTAVRTEPVSGNLTNNATSGVLQQFPTYLVGLEYVQFANENRSVTDYSVDMTFNSAVTAYLFLDNRLNGLSSGNKANSTDPSLTGNLQWVADDGWIRVNTGWMPNGAGDYLGHDEGSTVASADLRVHSGSGLVAGSGNGLNNFFAIYTKDFGAGTHLGVTKAIGNGSPNFYGFAVAPVPEPSSFALALVGFLALIGRRMVRKH